MTAIPRDSPHWVEVPHGRSTLRVMLWVFLIAVLTAAIIATTSPATTQEGNSELGLDQLQERVAALEATVMALSQHIVSRENSDTEVTGVVAEQEKTITADTVWYVCGAAGRRWRTGHPDC